MSEKVEIEFKFKIGDRVKDKYSRESFVVEKQEFNRYESGATMLWYYGSKHCGSEDNLTLVEPPLTIKEVLDMATVAEGCSYCIKTDPKYFCAHNLLAQIIKRGIVP